MLALQTHTITTTRKTLSSDKHLGFLFRIMLQAGHIGKKPTKSERDRAISIIVKGDL